MKIRLMALMILATVIFASCGGRDRKDASTADSNTIDTGINASSATNPNMTEGAIGDTSGMGTDTTDTTAMKP
ncbi:MAG: hypothetical protein EOO96_01150 [Pedobacter sp.]|nr:MAG: hypothetical protein EOO96_01150 [Pedobacter sp.]